MCHPMRRGLRRPAREHGVPRDYFARAGLPVPGPALGALRLQLEEVAAERLLNPVGAVSARSAARRAPPASPRRAGLGLTPRPAFEQPAEGEAATSLAASERMSTAHGGIGHARRRA